MTDSISKMIGQRATLLAQVVLTRRKDVQIIPLQEKDDIGVDLIARILTPIHGEPISPSFAVQVKGTANPLDEKTATRMANQLVRDMPAKSLLFSPLVLMIFSMEGDRGFWGWVMEPLTAGPNAPGITRPEKIAMAEITLDSLDELYSRVISWFKVMGHLSSLQGKRHLIGVDSPPDDYVPDTMTKGPVLPAEWEGDAWVREAKGDNSFWLRAWNKATGEFVTAEASKYETARKLLRDRIAHGLTQKVTVKVMEK